MRLVLKLLLCVAIAYGLAAYMTIPANPEIAFWRGVDMKRDAEILASRQAHAAQPSIFFTGGSSCAFSIDPAVIEKTCGLPTFNVGLPFAAGPKYLLDQALRKTRPGDIVVIALEPDALVYQSDFKPSSFSFGLAALDGTPSATIGKSSFGGTLSLRDYLNYSRPGPVYFATWLGKLVTGKGYRYLNEDIRYHGRVQTAISTPSLPQSEKVPPGHISTSGKELLQTFKKAASERGVRLVYTMPWLLTAESGAGEIRRANLGALKAITQIIPTLDDGYAGVATVPSHFSDTPLHLSESGSAIRSQAVAESLAAWLQTLE